MPAYPSLPTIADRCLSTSGRAKKRRAAANVPSSCRPGRGRRRRRTRCPGTPRPTAAPPRPDRPIDQRGGRASPVERQAYRPAAVELRRLDHGERHQPGNLRRQPVPQAAGDLLHRGLTIPDQRPVALPAHRGRCRSGSGPATARPACSRASRSSAGITLSASAGPRRLPRRSRGGCAPGRRPGGRSGRGSPRSS